MRVNLLTCASALGALALLPATASQATVYIATYTGTVTDSSDYANFFGLGNGAAALDGAAFVATYTFDTAVGLLDTQPTYQQLHSGSNYVQPASVTANLTINGHTASFDGGYIGQAYTGDPNIVSEEAADEYGGSAADYGNNTYTFASIAGAPFVFDTPVSLTPAEGQGRFNLIDLENGEAVVYASGSFVVSGYELRAAAVPEPGAWLLMLAGIGSLGVAMRARRAATASVA